MLFFHRGFEDLRQSQIDYFIILQIVDKELQEESKCSKEAPRQGEYVAKDIKDFIKSAKESGIPVTSIEG